jgi:hypothetical protein
MNFPARRSEPISNVSGLADALGVVPLEVVANAFNYMALVESEKILRELVPDMAAKFLMIEREETRALRQSVIPIVAFLFGAFFVPLVRPHLWRSSGWTGRTVILVLVSIGVWHTVSKIWAAIKLHTDDARTVATDDPMLAKQWSRRQAILFIALAAIGCGLVGTLIGMSFSDSLLSAMPMFFDPSIRLELLLYPWIMVLLIDAGYSLGQRIDI